MLAIEFAQLQPIAIAMLIGMLALKFMNMKQRHQPRELFKDESSKVDLELEEELHPLKPAAPAFAYNTHEEMTAANAALHTKLVLLDQMLIAADEESHRLYELLHEARSIRIPGVLRDGEGLNESLADSDDDASVELSSTATSQTTKISKPQFVRLLHQSGFSPQEVSNAVKLPLETVLEILGTSEGQDRKAS